MVNTLKKLAVDLNLNVYSIAVMDRSGIHEVQVNPSNQCSNNYSVAKSYTLTAIGMLRDRKMISLDEKVCDILGRFLKPGYDERWKKVTVDHLISHTAGIEIPLDIDVDDVTKYPSDDYLQVIFSEPLSCEPGTHYKYTDAAYYLLSRIVSEITGERLDEFLRPLLFNPLSFREFAWSSCPQGYCIGATGLFLRTSDMVKLGFVYANGGLFDKTRIISEDWCELSVKRGWFSKIGNTSIYAKGGLYGQILWFSPEKHIAGAWRAYERTKNPSILLEKISLGE